MGYDDVEENDPLYGMFVVGVIVFLIFYGITFFKVIL